MGRDFYAILGVPRGTADPEVLKKAYKTLALKWHPDRNKSPEAKAKFQEISQVCAFRRALRWTCTFMTIQCGV
jgi:DnaJ-class molecular chaperone